MENTSGLNPLGRAVLIRPYTAARMSSIIELPPELEGRMSTVEQRAVVIEVGAHAWSEEPVPRAAPGDHVIVAKFTGHQIMGTDGVQYRAVNDRDIFLRITPDEERAAPLLREVA